MVGRDHLATQLRVGEIETQTPALARLPPRRCQGQELVEIVHRVDHSNDVTRVEGGGGRGRIVDAAENNRPYDNAPVVLWVCQ